MLRNFKTYLLLGLMSLSSFYCNGMAQPIPRSESQPAPVKFVKQAIKDIPPRNFFYYLYELYRIANVGNQDENKVWFAGCSGQAVHGIYLLPNLMSAYGLGKHAINAQYLDKQNFTLNAINCFNGINSNVSFIKTDNNIANNAKQIALHNKLNKPDLTKFKVGQITWLSANYLLPYLYYRLSNSMYKNNNWFVIKTIAGLSESVRKSLRYTKEQVNLEDLENFQIQN